MPLCRVSKQSTWHSGGASIPHDEDIPTSGRVSDDGEMEREEGREGESISM